MSVGGNKLLGAKEQSLPALFFIQSYVIWIYPKNKCAVNSNLRNSLIRLIFEKNEQDNDKEKKY